MSIVYEVTYVYDGACLKERMTKNRLDKMIERAKVGQFEILNARKVFVN